MRSFVPGAMFVMLILCRLALSGEVTHAPGSESLAFARVIDYGALGLFLGYMIWDRRKRDELDQKRDEKDREVAERFQELDREVVKALTESTRVQSEICLALKEQIRLLYTKPCMRPDGTRTRDTDCK